MKFNDLKSTIRNYEDYNLSLADYREIEKSINGEQFKFNPKMIRKRVKTARL